MMQHRFRVQRNSAQRNRSNRVHAYHVFLTYPRCSLGSAEQFEDAFRVMLRRNSFDQTEYYGCREDDGRGDSATYHVLVRLGKQPNWDISTAKVRFRVEDNNTYASIQTPKSKDGGSSAFIQSCLFDLQQKGGTCFGDSLFFRRKQQPSLSVSFTCPNDRDALHAECISFCRNMKERFSDLESHIHIKGGMFWCYVLYSYFVLLIALDSGGNGGLSKSD